MIFSGVADEWETDIEDSAGASGRCATPSSGGPRPRQVRSPRRTGDRLTPDQLGALARRRRDRLRHPRSTTAEVLVADGGRVVAGVDELDRIGDAEQAQRFPNEVKAVSTADNRFSPVAVSDDALADLELSAPAHVLSGGLARELVRHVEVIGARPGTPAEQTGAGEAAEGLRDDIVALLEHLTTGCAAGPGGFESLARVRRCPGANPYAAGELLTAFRRARDWTASGNGERPGAPSEGTPGPRVEPPVRTCGSPTPATSGSPPCPPGHRRRAAPRPRWWWCCSPRSPRR